MTRQPPRSPLFPNTTLFRSGGDRRGARAAPPPRRRRRRRLGGRVPALGRGAERDGDDALRRRSEEHTSELQSRQYLVCRLLLEKKNIARRVGLIFSAEPSGT